MSLWNFIRTSCTDQTKKIGPILFSIEPNIIPLRNFLNNVDKLANMTLVLYVYFTCISQFTQFKWRTKESVFGLLSNDSLPVQIHDHAEGNEDYIQIDPLVPRARWAHPFNQQDTTARTTTATTTPTASRTTASATTATTGPPTGTRRYTIPVIAEVFCADSKVLLETATLRHSVFAIIGTATEECEDLPWKRSYKGPNFIFA